MDPDELAGWIFDLQLEETGQIFVEVADLVEALGARGLATFRRRLDEADRSLPADDSYYDKYDEEAVNQRAAIAYVREHFLLAFEPDVEVLKAFYAENPLPGRDRSIAEALLAAAEPLKAVEYAKNRAFAHLRERAVRSGPDSGAAASLVHLLFAVGDVEQAWEAAREFGLDVRELPDIAWALAHQHPADAISIMLRAAEPTIDRRSDHAGFNRAAYLLTELKELHQRAGWTSQTVWNDSNPPTTTSVHCWRHWPMSASERRAAVADLAGMVTDFQQRFTDQFRA